MPNIKDFKYAVRGEIAIRAQQIEREMEKGKKFPFEKITMLHVGNPQQLGQRGFTFNRQVLAACLTRGQISGISKDAMDRAKLYLSKVPNQEFGAYATVSQGYRFVQQEIKEFIERRDGYEANADQIYLTNGASEGIQQWL